MIKPTRMKANRQNSLTASTSASRLVAGWNQTLFLMLGNSHEKHCFNELTKAQCPLWVISGIHAVRTQCLISFPEWTARIGPLSAIPRHLLQA